MTTDGPGIANAGSVIKSIGGVDAVLSRCEQSDLPIEELRASFQARKNESRKVKQEKQLELLRQKASKYIEEFNSLVKRTGDIIPVNYDNLRIVMGYLSTQNWGMWCLPKMSISYSANQYDCDGVTAVTIILDQPYSEPKYGIEDECKFVFGNPHGYLVEYYKTR